MGVAGVEVKNDTRLVEQAAAFELDARMAGINDLELFWCGKRKGVR